MSCAYRFLLHLYPSAHRHEYGEEMLAVFLEVQGGLGALQFAA